MDGQLIFDALSDGQYEAYLRLWWLYVPWAGLMFCFPFAVRRNKRRPDAEQAARLARARSRSRLAGWFARNPAAAWLVGLVSLLPFAHGLWAYHRDAARLERGDFELLSGYLSSDTKTSATGGRSPTEQDTLVVRGMPFDVSCPSPPGSGPIGAPGACLPVRVGDDLRIAYAPLPDRRYERAPLRIWRLPSAPRQDGITADTPVRLGDRPAR